MLSTHQKQILKVNLLIPRKDLPLGCADDVAFGAGNFAFSSLLLSSYRDVTKKLRSLDVQEGNGFDADFLNFFWRRRNVRF